MCGPRGGPSENRVRLAPRFRHPLWTFPHPWWLHERALACKRLYRSTLPRSARSRRRSVPPSLSVSVSQSVNQRWRERPRCPAPPVTPGRRDGVVHAIVGRAACRCLRAQVVQDERAARVHVVRVEIRRNNAADESNRNRFARVAHVSRNERRVLRIQIQPSHHRAFHAGAVLGVVNALRFASTRPAAGPSGIDDACARHDVGLLRDGRLSDDSGGPRKARLTRDFAQAYVDVSRLCPTAHPPHRTQCMRSALPVVALRARFKRIPHNIASGCYAVTLRVSRRT